MLFVEDALRYTYTGQIAAYFWDLLGQLWYFAVLGAAISTLAWRLVPKGRYSTWLKRHGGGSALLSSLMASLLGILSPMCTFAAIPVVGRLLQRGIPAPPLMAFLVASPLMNPALFVNTSGIISTQMAVARCLSAVVLGCLAGGCAWWAGRQGWMDFAVMGRLAPVEVAAVAGGADLTWGQELGQLLRRFGGDLAFVAKYFCLGLLIAALAKVFLSEEWVLYAVGPGNPWAVPLAVALGIPLYACGGGSLPVIQSMMGLGMTPGAALAFFIAGPATKISTLTMLAAVFERRLVLLYLGVMLGGALVWGYLYPFGEGAFMLQGSDPGNELLVD